MHKGFSQAPTGICCALLCRLKRAKLVAKNRARNCNLLWFPVVNSDFGKRVFFLKGLILNASLGCPRPVETPRGVVKTSLLLYFPSTVTPYCPEVTPNFAKGRTGNGAAQKVQNNAKFWERAACPVPAYRLRHLAGRGFGGEPARDAVQRAACSGLALPRAAEGPVCPVLHLAGALVRSSLPCHSRSEG